MQLRTYSSCLLHKSLPRTACRLGLPRTGGAYTNGIYTDVYTYTYGIPTAPYTPWLWAAPAKLYKVGHVLLQCRGSDYHNLECITAPAGVCTRGIINRDVPVHIDVCTSMCTALRTVVPWLLPSSPFGTKTCCTCCTCCTCACTVGLFGSGSLKPSSTAHVVLTELAGTAEAVQY